MAAFATVFCGNVCRAVPAKPGLVTMRQPDGTEIKVRIMGDEHAHCYLSEDGYLLVNDNDTFYYANADASGNVVRSQIVARPVTARSAEAKAYLSGVNMSKVFTALERRDTAVRKARRGAASQKSRLGLFDTGFPSTGDQKGLVVLVEYKDVKFTTPDPYDYFNRMLNENGFSDYGGTGCASEYFRECSKNQFRPQFDVYGPITLSQNMSYYGGNDWYGNDSNPQKMPIEACQQLDATVDFSEYDRDGDGYIDNVFVFYAGRGEANGGAANTVWPHSWNVTAGESTTYTFDGVILDRYACSNEWEGSRPDGVGTFIHEFSHVMGLPDLYATSYTSAFTPGAWSVLDYGPYNNDGCTPPLYSAYERYSLGWLSPRVLDGPANVTLKNISANEACMVKTGDENEFFLFENRQQTGWDKYIPGHGMLVWHVDFGQYVWNQNTVNNSASHQYVDLEEADGTQSDASRDGDAFPGTSGVTSFTDNTRPSMKTWAGRSLNLPLTEITETGGVITFKVAGGILPSAPVTATEATDIHAEGFTAHWLSSEDEGVTYELSVYTKIVTGSDRVVYNNVEGYTHLNVGTETSAVVTGLNPATDYFYVVYVNNGDAVSDASNEIGVTTGGPLFQHFAPEALDATDVTDNSFTARWLPIEEAVGYEVNVYNRVKGEPNKSTVDFTGGIKALPTGWTTNTSLTYSNAAYSGAAVPSLRFAVNDASLTSPRFDDDIYSLTFWHRGVSTSGDNRLIVSGRGAGGEWSDMAEVEIGDDAGGVTTTIDNIPEGTRQVRISYQRTGTGSVAIDDVAIEWGGEVSTVAFGTFEAGNAVSLPITGLTAATTYYYTVVATTGTISSRPSNEIAVTTTDDINSGIAATTVASGLRVEGRRLFVAAGTDVTVSDIAGRVIYSSASSDASASVAFPAGGVYVIKHDGRCHKIVVK